MVTYDKYDIVFQEIPNEVSLAFTIEGCPNRCVGCHSPHLREQNGDELTEKCLINILDSYKKAITCVLFLGGDAFHDELYLLAEKCQELGYKTAIYSGNDILNEKLFDVFDYYKLGSWQYKLGGLTSETTNQRLYKCVDNIISDITEQFRIKIL